MQKTHHQRARQYVFLDFETDGLKHIVRMKPSELPDDIPYSFTRERTMAYFVQHAKFSKTFRRELLKLYFGSCNEELLTDDK